MDETEKPKKPGLKKLRANYRPGMSLREECDNCGKQRYNRCTCDRK